MTKKFRTMGLRYIGDIELEVDDIVNSRFEEIWRYDFCRPQATMWTIFNHDGERYVEDKINRTIGEYCKDLADERFDKLIVYGYIRGQELPVKLATAICTYRTHI